MCAFFRLSQDGESENPVGLQSATLAPSGKALFFGSVSFGLTKEMNSAKPKAVAVAVAVALELLRAAQDQELPPAAGHFSLLSPKKR